MMEVAKRFEDYTEDALVQLLDSSDSQNTRKSILNAVRIFESYLASKNTAMADFIALPLEEKSSCLRHFYASARNQKGEYYSKKTLITLRYGLQKHFLKVLKVDITNDSSFKEANDMFKCVLKKLKQEGKGKIEHKQPVNDEDLNTLYAYLETVKKSPAGLQNEVFIDFMLYFCNRGRENLRELKKDHFVFCGEGDHRYIALRDMQTKNHQGGMFDNSESQGGRMYAIPDNPARCPLTSFVEYYSHLNPECQHFWQRPKVTTDSDIWYDKAAVGVNTLGEKMKVISKAAKLTAVYTNHCLRATSVTVLDKQGFEARHIMSVSGHKSETSIRSYSRTDEAHKRQMSTALSSVITGNAATSIVPVQRRTTTAQNMNASILPSNNEDKENFPDDWSDVDMLLLTDSQEKYVMSELGSSHATTNATVNYKKSSSTNHKSQPIFNFHNVGTVHVHYH